MATQLLRTPIPHTDGRDIIEAKAPVGRAVFDRLLPELQGRAFMITGIEDLNVLARVRDLSASLAMGEDFRDLKAQILEEISPWLITSTEPEEAAKQFAEARRRAEMLLRMHGWQAYAQTQFELMEQESDAFPYRQYLSSDDSRVRATHAALHEKVFPADHSFWANHTPPWEFGCRCDCVPLTEAEVAEIRAAEDTLPLEQRAVMEGAALQEVEQLGRLRDKSGGTLDIRTPRERTGSGYEWRPGDRGLDLDTILQNYDPIDRLTWEAWAKATEIDDEGTTVWETFGGQPDAGEPDPGQAPAASSPKKKAAKPAIDTAGRKSPVSDALDLKIRDKARVIRALNAINTVHDDGALPKIPLTGSVGKDYDVKGFFAHRGGKAETIAIRADYQYARLTTLHEVGHFLDHQAFGTPGRMESEVTGSAIWDIIDLAMQTPTVQSIPNLFGARSKMTAYLLRRREIWARCYAQYIAEESGSPEIMADLNGMLTGPLAATQWPASEFAPIRAAITAHLQSLNWK